MAKQVEEIIVGIDTAQQWLDLYRADTQASERIDNTVEAVKAWLKGFSTPLAIITTGRPPVMDGPRPPDRLTGCDIAGALPAA